MREEVSSKEEESVAVKRRFGLRVTSHAQMPSRGGWGDPFADRVGLPCSLHHDHSIVT